MKTRKHDNVEHTLTYLTGFIVGVIVCVFAQWMTAP